MDAPFPRAAPPSPPHAPRVLDSEAGPIQYDCADCGVPCQAWPETPAWLDGKRCHGCWWRSDDEPPKSRRSLSLLPALRVFSLSSAPQVAPDGPRSRDRQSSALSASPSPLGGPPLEPPPGTLGHIVRPTAGRTGESSPGAAAGEPAAVPADAFGTPLRRLSSGRIRPALPPKRPSSAAFLAEPPESVAGVAASPPERVLSGRHHVTAATSVPPGAPPPVPPRSPRGPE